MAFFKAKFVETGSSFTANLIEPLSIFKVGFGEIERAYVEDWYEGDYVVTPKVNPQTLETAGLIMKDDVLVKSIPYYQTANPKGMTVYIGSEV